MADTCISAQELPMTVPGRLRRMGDGARSESHLLHCTCNDRATHVRDLLRRAQRLPLSRGALEQTLSRRRSRARRGFEGRAAIFRPRVAGIHRMRLSHTT